MNPADDAPAIRAAINAKFTAPIAVTLTDAKTATSDHIVVFVTRRYVPERLGSGEVPLPGGRVVTRYVALDQDNVDVMRQRTTAALEDQILPGDIGPFTFETGDDIEDDDKGWFWSADTWTY